MFKFGMLIIIKKLLDLSGDYSKKLKISFVINFFEEIFAIIPIIMVFYVIVKISSNEITINDIWFVTALIFLSVILRVISRRLVDVFQAATGYKIFARERISLGDKLKRFPMGYFSEDTIGNITAVATSDMVFIEEFSMPFLARVVTAYLNTGIGVILLTILDYRIGIISIFTIIIAITVLNKHEKIIKKQSNNRQKVQSELVSAVLEYVKGISVIKSFNMVGVRAQKINTEFKKTRDSSIAFEKKVIPTALNFDNCFSLGIGLTVLAVTYFALNKTLSIDFMLMILIFIFQMYIPFKSLSSLSAQIHIMGAALDRYKAVDNVKIMDEDGEDISISYFDIEFENVCFSYEETEVLNDISFKVPENSMTALVGRSGSGKTTIANLIARFWDVQFGEVKIGGVNVKRLTYDSLIKNISMVFQNVYLFNDTVLNNIKFGKKDASMDEVVKACKKARCHDFILKLEEGYDTIIGEGGFSLSGGEKQRISIARAILKDAPIVILDEATANVDPDNEKHIQKAIDELVKNKTLIMIAHKLSTIKNADQILVIDKGKIIQRGTHNILIKEEGLYGEFWQRRIKAKSWKINK